MHFTRTLHPPGGANASLAVIGGDKVYGHSHTYVLFPVLAGDVIMLIVVILYPPLSKSEKALSGILSVNMRLSDLDRNAHDCLFV